MTGLTVICMLVIFVAVMVLSSRFFYNLELKSYTKKISKVLQLDILELSYSFDQMVYFISLPSNLAIISNARKEDVYIKCEYTSFYLPELVGIRIYIQSQQEDLLLAYLPIKDFRLPKLDSLLEQGSINEAEYLKISMNKLIHPATLTEITEEVYKQLQVGKSEMYMGTKGGL
jgi:hypothetical protein